MSIWIISRYFGQWFFVSISILLFAIAFLEQPSFVSITGLPLSWYLYGCAFACLLHGVMPCVGTWRVVFVMFIALSVITGFDSVNEKIELQAKFEESRPEELVKIIGFIAAFLISGVLALLHFRHAMLSAHNE